MSARYGALWLLFLAVFVAGCGGPAAPVLPTPGTPAYEAYAAEFFTGLVALQVDAPSTALTRLTTATELVPAEPAGWANLGLYALRQSQFPVAEQHFKRAAELAPDSAALASLQGLLEVRRGQFDAAAPFFRHALALAPADLKARYALVQALDNHKEPAVQAECRTLLDEILARAPHNLIALLERARLAAKASDAGAFKGAVAALKGHTAGWPADAQQSLGELERAQASPETATEVLFLQQMLQPVPAYQESLAAVATPAAVVGEPVGTFMKMVPPGPAPAPADEGLVFKVGAPGAACGAAAAVFGLDAVKPVVVSADAAKAAGQAFPGAGQAPSRAGLAVADLDGDFRSDLVLCGAGGLSVLLAQDGGAWKPGGTYPGAWYGAWPIDIELDGDLDLVVGAVAGPTALFRNGGDGKLERVMDGPFASVMGARGFAAGDLDGDGTPDVALVDSASKLHVFTNLRAGRFGEIPAPALGPVAAVTIGDVNADGKLDLVVLLVDGAVHRITRRGSAWDDAVIGQGPAKGAFVALADLDDNGALDVVAAADAETVLLVGTGTEWRRVAGPADFGALGVVDLDGDGRLDLIGRNKAGALVTAANAGTKPYHWQVLRFRANKAANGDKRINSFGVGGIVEVRSKLQVQTALIEGPVVHLGLGAQAKSEAVRVVWPNGTLDGEFDLKGDQAVTAEQRLKGSCPWVFTNDGHGMTFVTDFLWRSPLGLRINAQDTAGVAQTEDRVKIRGDQLAAVDGKYDVRITAELWETHFFDHVALLVVDHPSTCDIFVDERFAPRKAPALDVRALTRPVPVLWAKDEAGRDVTADVAARDGRYLDVGRGEYQGVTRDHWVELPAPPPGASWLVAYGWIHPTDSSLNVAIAQGGRVQPRGLALEARDADGSWRVVDGELGFPAGKNKTILVPLAGAHGRPVRLRTNLEIFWDQLAFAGDAPAEPAVQRLAPVSADLRYRGFSKVVAASTAAPELPRYAESAGTLPRWRDLEGFHTRFGDVRELLQAVDDRYVIMNAGDELALAFAAPAAPAPGLVRDFVLVGDGWEKDGDYNTAFSATVLPLPSHGQAYDRAPGSLAQDPVYRRHAADWKTYHTRYVTPNWYCKGLR